VKGDIAAAVRRMKAESGPDMTILGSGSIVKQLAETGLIDGYQLVVHPVVLGAGRTMFDGLAKPLSLTRTDSRAFPGGKVVLSYEARA
jgi:dihydrofolate reductase